MLIVDEYANSSSNPQTSSPLSTPAKAGIGAGIGALFLLVVIGVFIWRRRSRTIRNHSEHISASEAMESSLENKTASQGVEWKGELHGHSVVVDEKDRFNNDGRGRSNVAELQ